MTKKEKIDLYGSIGLCCLAIAGFIMSPVLGFMVIGIFFTLASFGMSINEEDE